jgi:hypothetical protein
MSNTEAVEAMLDWSTQMWIDSKVQYLYLEDIHKDLRDCIVKLNAAVIEDRHDADTTLIAKMHTMYSELSDDTSTDVQYVEVSRSMTYSMQH